MLHGITKRARIYDSREFRKAIEKEKSRAQRYGEVFSCVVFRADSATRSHGVEKHLLEAIRSRIRSVDEIGWLSDSEIGVLLVGADRDNAMKLAQDVVRRADRNGDVGALSIYLPCDTHGCVDEQNHPIRQIS